MTNIPNQGRVQGRRTISHKEVQERLGCSDMHIWRLRHWPQYAHLNFPKPVKLGIGKSGRLAWIEDEVDAWLLERARASLSGGEAA